MWMSEVNNQGFVNRPGKATKMKRRANKLTGQTNWFKQTKSKPKTNFPDPKRRNQIIGKPIPTSG